MNVSLSVSACPCECVSVSMSVGVSVSVSVSVSVRVTDCDCECKSATSSSCVKLRAQKNSSTLSAFLGPVLLIFRFGSRHFLLSVAAVYPPPPRVPPKLEISESGAGRGLPQISEYGMKFDPKSQANFYDNHF